MTLIWCLNISKLLNKILKLSIIHGLALFKHLCISVKYIIITFAM